ATLQGVATYPYSPKHLGLYQKFGYRPKGLVVVTGKPMDRREIVQATRPAKPGLGVRRYSSLEEAKKKAAMQRVRRITNALERGYHPDFTMVRMKRGKQDDDERPDDLVLDDWR